MREPIRRLKDTFVNKDTLLKILNIACYIGNGLLALITLLSGYGGAVNPETSTIPAILAMTFPLWLALTIIILIINLFVSRRMAIIQGVTVLLCIGPILNFCPLNISSSKMTPEEQERSFTFMSYNVYGLLDYKNPSSPKDSTKLRKEVGEDRSNPTMSYILKQNLDIICLQEFYMDISPKSQLFSRALYDSICDRYPYKVRGAANAIFSKYPIYSVPVKQPDDPTAFYLAAVVEIQGHKTLVVSAHLQSIGLDANDKALYQELTQGEGSRQAIAGVKRQLYSKLSKAFRNRSEQARLIRQQIDSIGIENVIIAGDFNDIQGCYAMRELARDDFKSAFTMAAFGPVITYHANRFYFHIDHILYRGDMEAVKFHTDNKFGRSDHYPVDATFVWGPSAKTVNRNLKGIDLINREEENATEKQPNSPHQSE